MPGDGMRNGKTAGGVILILLGITFLLANYGLLTSEIWKLWPLILIAVGAFMLLKGEKEK